MLLKQQGIRRAYCWLSPAIQNIANLCYTHPGTSTNEKVAGWGGETPALENLAGGLHGRIG
jgi:hypothetical protein